MDAKPADSGHEITSLLVSSSKPSSMLCGTIAIDPGIGDCAGTSGFTIIKDALSPKGGEGTTVSTISASSRDAEVPPGGESGRGYCDSGKSNVPSFWLFSELVRSIGVVASGEMHGSAAKPNGDETSGLRKS